MVNWSHSRLSTYETCPLKFYYKYVEQPDVEEVLGKNIAALLGTAVHETLEHLYKEISFARDVSLDALLEFYQTAWGKEWTDDVIIPEYDEVTWKHLGEKYLADYYASHKPFDKEKTIALERMIRLELGDYSLIGYIDRIAEEKPGRYKIIDYKTNKYLQPQEKFDNDRQLGLYEIGLRQMFNDVKNVDLVWEMLHYGKQMVSHRTKEQLEQLKKSTIALIEEIESAKDFPPQESPLCEWCEFQAVCPKKKHEKATAAMTVKEFKKDEGVKLANVFIQTKAKLDEWGLKNEEAKKDILAYGQQHNVVKVIGSAAAVSISKSQRKGFDPKVEDLLKKAGLWEEFSKLDSGALAKALDNLDPALKKKLEKLETFTDVTSVRLVKK